LSVKEIFIVEVESEVDVEVLFVLLLSAQLEISTVVKRVVKSLVILFYCALKLFVV